MINEYFHAMWTSIKRSMNVQINVQRIRLNLVLSDWTFMERCIRMCVQSGDDDNKEINSLLFGY